MKIVKPSVVVEDFDGVEMVKNIERAGRTCYKSETKITNTSATRFIQNIIKRGHESVLEHEKISVRIICDRGITHELVRHRIASYSQESTRYVNYNNKEMEFIKPCFWSDDMQEHEGGLIYTDDMYEMWEAAMEDAEKSYKYMIEKGASPQEARSILPNSLKTEIVTTMNIRAWRNFFGLRCAKDAHPQMQEIALMILEKFMKQVPVLFDDLIKEGWDV